MFGTIRGKLAFDYFAPLVEVAIGIPLLEGFAELLSSPIAFCRREWLEDIKNQLWEISLKVSSIRKLECEYSLLPFMTDEMPAYISGGEFVFFTYKRDLTREGSSTTGLMGPYIATELAKKINSRRNLSKPVDCVVWPTRFMFVAMLLRAR